MKFLIFLSVIFSIATAQQVVYTQYNSYAMAKCSGQPVYMISSQGGECLITPSAQPTCQSTAGPNSVYQSQESICVSGNNSISLDGIVQWYVSSTSWTDSASCQGNPSTVELMVADALCHPAASDDGVITSYFSVNCNGDNPLYKTCQDSACNNCTQSISSDTCQILGAGTSKQVTCVKPGSTSISSVPDAGDSGAGHLFASTALLLASLTQLVF